MTKNPINSLSHTRWKCKYHLVFAPKFRRQVVYGKICGDIGRILRTLCEQKKVEIHEAEACPDHIHMLVSIPPHLSVSQFVGYLKGKSSLMIFDRHANLKYKYGNRHFGCRGYFVDTAGANKNAIAEYIRHQLDEDIACEQLSFKESIDPFTGGKCDIYYIKCIKSMIFSSVFSEIAFFMFFKKVVEVFCLEVHNSK